MHEATIATGMGGACGIGTAAAGRPHAADLEAWVTNFAVNPSRVHASGQARRVQEDTGLRDLSSIVRYLPTTIEGCGLRALSPDWGAFRDSLTKDAARIRLLIRKLTNKVFLDSSWWPMNEKRGATPPLLAIMNSEAILHALRDKGPLSRAELARELGLSRPTVSKLVEKLLLAEWVKEIGEGRSVGGRRPVLLSFNQRAGYVLAIDLGGTKALCGVTDLTGKVVAQVKRPSRMSEGPEVSLPALDRTLDETTRKAGISPDQLMAIGVSSPGVMDPRSETFAFAPNLRGFGDVSLSKFLHEKYGVSVVITNDVNAALLGESWLGAARGWRHVVMVSVGTGLGAGILVDGRLYKGASGGAGEVGYMAFDERAAQTKEHGFFETVASGYGFAEAASSMPWAKPGPASEQDGVLDADSRTQELIERAQRGETEAAGVVHQFAKYMALGINNIVGLLDPEIVVLGGSMMIQHDWLMRKVVERFHEYSTFSVPIRLAELGDASGLYGAVKQALDLVFSSRFAVAGGREARRFEDGLRSGGTW